MSTHTYKRGTDLGSWKTQLLQKVVGKWVPVSLVGCTVRLQGRRPGQTALALDASVIIVDVDTATVEWPHDSALAIGEYHCEWRRVRLADNKDDLIPNKGYDLLVVEDDVAPDA